MSMFMMLTLELAHAAFSQTELTKAGSGIAYRSMPQHLFQPFRKTPRPPIFGGYFSSTIHPVPSTANSLGNTTARAGAEKLSATQMQLAPPEVGGLLFG